MTKIWSAITTFNILYLLNLWILDRTKKIVISVFSIDDRVESIPIFGLSLGALTTIISYYLFFLFAKENLHKPWYERIPPLWVEIDPRTDFAKIWGRVLIVLCILFPLAAQTQFWIRFHYWDAWSNHSPTKGEQVDLYKPVSPTFLLKWDDHRYGNFSEKSDPKHKGVSYVPLWQPILMIMLTGVVIWFAAINMFLIWKRRRNEGS